MNQTAPTHDPAIREVPLSRLALAPENVRKTPSDALADRQLRASIAAHGLLENLVARVADASEDGSERFAVIAGGRRLAALQALAGDGVLDADHPVPCLIAANDDASELSLAENVVRIAMHPADQVVAFTALAASGSTVAAIAARFGVSERTVEQRLRLGNAAPELLDAYRAGNIDLEILKAFAITADHDRQRSLWEQVSAQGYRPSAWQVRRLLTEERVPGRAALARFVGVEAYEAAGGAVLRDLFADDDEHGVWFEDPKLLTELAMKKLRAAADELATRWKWAQAAVEVDWSATASYGRVHPEPGAPTDEEAAEITRLRRRHEELAELEDDAWTDALVGEAEALDARLDAIEAAVEARARFRTQDFAIAGCIATIGPDGALQVIQGLVKPEDLPKEPTTGANGHDAHAGHAAAARIDAPAVTAPAARPADPQASAREEAGVGVGLADDLRAIRTALIKGHLASNFEAAFDLVLFQMVRAVFASGYTASYHALDIGFTETPDRPTARMNDEDFAAWSPGEAMLADWSSLPFEWMEEEDDAARFAALRELPREDKERLFAAAAARTVKGQLAWEHDARPELEATVARLDIDFAGAVRPTANMLWSRIRKDRMLAIARRTLGAAWAAARSKSRKADLATAMEEAFAAGDLPLGVGPAEHAAALAWTMPGFAAFDAGGVDDPEDQAFEPSVEAAPVSGDAETEPGDAEGVAPPDDSNDAPVQEETVAEPADGDEASEEAPAEPSIAEAIDATNRVPTADGSPRVIVQTVGALNGSDGPAEAGDGMPEVPEFLRRIH